MAFVRQSKFRHVYGQTLKKEQCYDNVRITKSAWDGSFCAVNPKWVAVLSDASGSSAFYVIDLSKTGRLDIETPMISGHKGQVLELQWCPHDDDVIASAGEDCVVKIWRIPSEGLTKNLLEPSVNLVGHQRRVGAVMWHPTAANVLVSGGQEGRLIVWNIAKAEAAIVLDLPSYVLSMSFNYLGSKLAVTCKDKMLRVIDIRAKKVVQEGQAHEGSKPSLCTFVRDDRIFTTGFSKMSKRCYALWHDQDLSKPIVADEIDSSNGTTFPFYDFDLSLLFLIGKGDSIIRYFEITNEAPYVHFLNAYSSNEPQRGFAYMPKRGVNVNINEVVRIYKMHAKNWVEVIQFLVPRKSEMFQDDLYPDTLSDEPALSADQWLAGQDAPPLMVSMRDLGRYGPNMPGPNRILTEAIANAPPPALPPVASGPSSAATPVVDGHNIRWSAYVPGQHSNGSDSAHGSRNHSKEPSPAPAVMPSPKPTNLASRLAIDNNSSHQNGTTTTHVPVATEESETRASPALAVPPVNARSRSPPQNLAVSSSSSPVSNATPQQFQQELLDSMKALTTQMQELTLRFTSLEPRLANVEKLLQTGVGKVKSSKQDSSSTTSSPSNGSPQEVTGGDCKNSDSDNKATTGSSEKDNDATAEKKSPDGDVMEQSLIKSIEF